MITSMTVYRTGAFDVTAPELPNKCGVEGKRSFKFEAWFSAESDSLDARGFIVDNAELYRHFRDEYAEPCCEFISCERMCLCALETWKTYWPHATKITVRVWGLEDVTYVEASWERPDNEWEPDPEYDNELSQYLTGREDGWHD